MDVTRFRSREEARRYLESRGYVFMGAPDRWRLPSTGTNAYAVIVHRAGAWIVIDHSPKKSRES